MPDPPSQAQGQRRANWVALRTLRQLPRPAGVTATGDPVFEVRSARLVLRGESNHFNRLVQCSKCKAEVVGPSVLGPDDLDRPPPPVICQLCVRASRSYMSWRPDVRPSDPVTVNDNAVALGVDAERADVDSEAAAGDALAPESNGMTGPLGPAEAAVARMEAFEATVVERLVGLEGMLQAHQEGIASLAVSLAESRAEAQRLAELQTRLADDQRALGERLAQVSDRPAETDRDDVERRLEKLRAELIQLVHAVQSEMQVAQERGLSEARLEAAARDQDAQQGMSRLSAMVAAIPADLASSIEKVVRREVDGVVESHALLAAAHSEIEAQVRGLLLSTETAQRRLHALERGVQGAIERFDARHDTQERRPANDLPVAGSLLASLDAELLAVERRLAQRAGAQRIQVLIESHPNGDPARADEGQASSVTSTPKE